MSTIETIKEDIKLLKKEIEQLKSQLGINNNAVQKQKEYKENWNPDWKGDPNDPRRWNGW